MTSSEKLTDEKYWEDYWQSKPDAIFCISHKYYLWDVFYSEIKSGTCKTFIELGGFPGYYSLFAKKHFGLEPTLLDFVYVPKVFNKLCEVNETNPEEIEIVNKDLFTYQPEQLFDIVFSAGLIEHFNNLEEIIDVHLKLCKSGGKVIMTLPNFRGTYGLTQWFWFRKNLDAHNLQSMKISVVRDTLDQLTSVGSFKIDYHGLYHTHLDNFADLTRFQKKCHRLFTSIVRNLAHWIPKKRLFAQSIVIVIEKK